MFVPKSTLVTSASFNYPLLDLEGEGLTTVALLHYDVDIMYLTTYLLLLLKSQYSVYHRVGNQRKPQ